MKQRGAPFIGTVLLFTTITAGLFIFYARMPARAAGFGITPPYVKNDSLARGSNYTQRIILVRDDASEDLDVTVTTDVPSAGQWITIAQGNKFTFPKGSLQAPMDVLVNIPNDASLGDYTGNIRVVISPHSGPQAGTVGITLGAQIDVNLKVTDQVFSSFSIRGIRVANAEEGHPFWWFYFPGKISFTMNIQNTGNVPAAPSRVDLVLYKPGNTKPLEETESTNNLTQVPPFKVQDVVAEIPTTMKAGGYSAAYTIYKGDSVVQQGMVDFSVLAPGSIPGYVGYGLEGIGLKNQLILVAMGLAILALLYFGGRKMRRMSSHRKALRDVPLPKPR